MGDAAEIMRRTGAEIVGSRTTCNICRALKVSEKKIKEVSPGETVDYGTFQVSISIADYVAEMAKNALEIKIHIINILIPIFLLTAIGTLLHRSNFTSESFFNDCARLTYWVGLPSLLFLSISIFTF